MNNKSITFLLGCLVTASITMQVLAQQPAEHEFIRGDMPPGVAARFYQMSDPALRGHVQAVQLVAPANTTVEVGDAQSSFGQAQLEQMTVNMGIGYVYRFKLSNLPPPDAAGQTLYPSIEVIGRLNPPHGLEKDFPIQVVVTHEDIEVALAGRMVTRVIYLEDPRDPLPHLHTVTDQPSIDVGRGQDPLRTAEQMGRPMAILRMGSRVPMEGEVAEWFAFGIAAPTVLPNPRSVNRWGLSERELRIIDEMQQAEAAAKAKAIASKEELTDKVSQADFSPNASGQDARIGIIGVTTDSAQAGVKFVAATTPIESETLKAKKPKWVAVKANAKPKPSTQPNMKSMTPIRAFASVANKTHPPAPSMANLDFTPVNQGLKKRPGPAPSMANLDFEPVSQGLKEPPRVYPAIRLPNEL